MSAAAAKSLQSCPTLCDPIDGGPPGSPVPGILQARTLEWVAISFSNAWKWKVKVKSLSRVQLLATPWTAAHQAPPSVGLSRQEYWSGSPFLSPGDLHDPGIEPGFPALQADALPAEPPGKPEWEGKAAKSGHMYAHAQSLSRVRLYVTPWTAAHQAPLSTGFPRKNTGVGRASRELVMDREDWRAAVCGVAKSRTRLSGWTELGCHFLTRGSSWPRDRAQVSCVSCIGRRVLHHWATWEFQGLGVRLSRESIRLNLRVQGSSPCSGSVRILGFPVSQRVKNPPAMQETWLWSLGWEDTLEKGMAIHSSILPGEFHGPYSPWGCKESDTTERLSLWLPWWPRR